MAIRGWVYVITNKAMPDLVKVGYSTKDPTMRAKELDHTGSPHSYRVEYDVLVQNPRDTERTVHAALADCREGKEWFRCPVQEAVGVIRRVVGEGAILENVQCALKTEPYTEPRQCKRPGCTTPPIEAVDGFWYCDFHLPARDTYWRKKRNSRTQFSKARAALKTELDEREKKT